MSDIAYFYIVTLIQKLSSLKVVHNKIVFYKCDV